MNGGLTAAGRGPPGRSAGRLLLGVIAVLLAWSISPSAPGASRPAVTLWLIPIELVDEHFQAHVPTAVFRQQIARFNERFGPGRPVTVLNTSVPALHDQLRFWSPELGAVQWPMIASQRTTLDRLEHFARSAGVHVNVRFLSWGQAFDELDRASRSVGIGSAQPLPDVAQMGSTWIAHFSAAGRLRELPRDDAIRWRDLPGAPRQSARYGTDIRLLFYWKRLPNESPDTPLCVLREASWARLLQALETCASERPSAYSPPYAMPIGLTYNLMHDLVPLVTAGGGRFVYRNWLGAYRADLTSAGALAVPTLIAQKAVLGDARLVAFPESTHQEIIPRFVEGGYRATSEPPAFLQRWLTETRAAYGADWAFWDHAEVSMLPSSFKGGSDLVAFEHSRRPELAFELIRFLVTDRAYVDTMARLGYLPANAPALGIDPFLSDLGGVDDARRAQLRELIVRTETAGIEYPLAPSWPTKVESAEVLEAFQALGRRLAEGGAGEGTSASVLGAAQALERTLNERLDPVETAWVNAQRTWPLIATITLVLAVLYIRSTQRMQRNATLALLLARAKLHSQLHMYERVMDDFSGQAVEHLADDLAEYSERLASGFSRHLRRLLDDATVAIDTSTGLRGRLRRTSRGPVTPAERRRREIGRRSLRSIVSAAWDGAREEYYASTAGRPPAVILEIAPECDAVRLGHRGPLMTMVLQEWFFNTLKEVSLQGPAPPGSPAGRAGVTVLRSWGRRVLRVDTPTRFDPHHAAVLESAPSAHDRIVAETSGEGLPLIRDLLWYGYGSRPVLRAGERTELRIPLRRRWRDVLWPLDGWRPVVSRGAGALDVPPGSERD